jgi:hypothetical protein
MPERHAKEKYSGSFDLFISDIEKSLVTLTPGVNVTKLFFSIDEEAK